MAYSFCKNMRITLLCLLLLSTIVRSESFFFSVTEEPDIRSARIEGDRIILSTKLERLPTPKVRRIEVVNEPKRPNLLRAYMTAEPAKGWFPMIKLEDKIVEIYLVTANRGPESYFEIEFPDWEEAVSSARLLAKLVEVPDDRLTINKKTAEQAGTGQPATRSQSKSEGNDKLQPEAEGRSR